MPLDATALRARLADRNVNPTQTAAVPTGASGGTCVELTLVFQRAFNAEDIFDALVVKYGAGKVISDHPEAARNTYQFRILP